MVGLLKHRAGLPPGRVALSVPVPKDKRHGVVQRLLSDKLGTEYTGSIGIGTKRGPTGELEAESVLNVVFDTGSTDLWVASVICSLGPCSELSRRRFNFSNSETFFMPDKTYNFATVYGSGELEGVLGIDDVRVGPMLVQQQEIGLIRAEHGELFSTLEFDGILGLGRTDTGAGTTAVFDSIVKQQVLPVPEFAFYLHPDFAFGGAVLWGGIDERLYEEPLVWYPVVGNDFWALELTAFTVGNQTLTGNGGTLGRSSRRPLVIVDSGTTFLTAMGDVYQALAAAVRTVHCSDMGTLPSLVYTLKDTEGQQHNITVPPEEYLVKAAEGGEWCFPGIMEFGPHFGPFEEHHPMILGEVFMRHHFTVFRRSSARGGRPEIGIARSARGASAQAFFEDTVEKS